MLPVHRFKLAIIVVKSLFPLAKKTPGSRLRFSRTRFQHFLDSWTIEPSSPPLTRPTKPCCCTLSNLPRQLSPYLPLGCHAFPEDTHLAFGGGAPGETILTQLSCHHLSANWLKQMVDSHLVSLFEDEPSPTLPKTRPRKPYWYFGNKESSSGDI